VGVIASWRNVITVQGGERCTAAARGRCAVGRPSEEQQREAEQRAKQPQTIQNFSLMLPPSAKLCPPEFNLGRRERLATIETHT
jgi:hypothetical protein